MAEFPTSCDVLVAGGGAAGVAAAVVAAKQLVIHAAAETPAKSSTSAAFAEPVDVADPGESVRSASRCGSSSSQVGHGSLGHRPVVLVEPSETLGGSVTEGMHRQLCGLYAHPVNDPAATLNAGFQRELVQAMLAANPQAILPRAMGQTWVLMIDTQTWQACLSQMLRDAGVCWVRGRATSVRQANADRIEAVAIDGQHWINVRAAIDCTGMGQVLQTIGEAVTQPRDPLEAQMLGGYCVRIQGIEGDASMLPFAVPYALREAVTQQALGPTLRFTMFHPGPGEHEGVVKFAIARPRVDPRDAAVGLSGTLAETAGESAPAETDSWIEQIDHAIDYLRQHVEGLSQIRITARSQRPLWRMGARLKGQATLTRDDVLGSIRQDEQAGRRNADAGAARAPSDASSTHAPLDAGSTRAPSGASGTHGQGDAAKVDPLRRDAVLGWWPIELWHVDNGPSYVYPEPGQPYAIPAGAVRSEAVANLFAAGACLSAGARAACSARAAGICLATGDMAGRLAAQHVCAP